MLLTSLSLRTGDLRGRPLPVLRPLWLGLRVARHVGGHHRVLHGGFQLRQPLVFSQVSPWQCSGPVSSTWGIVTEGALAHAASRAKLSEAGALAPRASGITGIGSGVSDTAAAVAMPSTTRAVILLTWQLHEVVVPLKRCSLFTEIHIKVFFWEEGEQPWPVLIPRLLRLRVPERV